MQDVIGIEAHERFDVGVSLQNERQRILKGIAHVALLGIGLLPLDDERPHPPRDLRRAVGAVVGNDKDAVELPGIFEMHEAFQGDGEDILLVMRADDDGELMLLLCRCELARGQKEQQEIDDLHGKGKGDDADDRLIENVQDLTPRRRWARTPTS